MEKVTTDQQQLRCIRHRLRHWIPRWLQLPGIQYPMRTQPWTHGSSGRPALHMSHDFIPTSSCKDRDARRQTPGSRLPEKRRAIPGPTCVRASRCQRPGLSIFLSSSCQAGHQIALNWTRPGQTALDCCLRQALPNARKPLQLPLTTIGLHRFHVSTGSASRISHRCWTA